MALSNLEELLMVKIGKQCVESNFITQSSVLSPWINARYLIREKIVSVVDRLSVLC